MADSGNPSLAGGSGSGEPSPSPSPPPASDSGVAWSSSAEKTEKELDPETAAMEMIKGDGVTGTIVKKARLRGAVP